MQSPDEILERIRSTLVELFELDRADIKLEARLYEGADPIYRMRRRVWLKP